jgi:uncharacterized protein (TIGR03083 family)
MMGLVQHISGVHRWAAEIVRTHATERIRRQSRGEAPDEPGALLASYEDGLAELLVVLGHADGDQPVWNWLDGRPAPARFWHRRMAHETAVHRWDAQAAAGHAQPMDAGLAEDGIDEFLDLVAVNLAHRPLEGPAGSLHLHATDAEGEWWLVLGRDHLEQRRQHAKADAAIRGPVSDLFLWLMNRRSRESPGLEVFGDPAVVARWATVTF